MSKSKGNVVNPDDMIEKYGCDALRLYLSFMGPYEQTMPWSTTGIEGTRKFVNRIWNNFNNKDKISETSSKELDQVLNKTIKKVCDDIEKLKHNTAVSSLMILLNAWEKKNSFLSKQDSGKFLVILAPFAPFLAEELWSKFIDKNTSVHHQSWPKVNKFVEDEIIITVMVDGKQRAILKLAIATKETGNKVEKLARDDNNIKKYLEGKKIDKVVYIPHKVINFVTK